MLSLPQPDFLPACISTLRKGARHSAENVIGECCFLLHMAVCWGAECYSCSTGSHRWVPHICSACWCVLRSKRRLAVLWPVYCECTEADQCNVLATWSAAKDRRVSAHACPNTFSILSSDKSTAAICSWYFRVAHWQSCLVLHGKLYSLFVPPQLFIPFISAFWFKL